MPRKPPTERSQKELSNPKYRRLSDACQEVQDQISSDELPEPSSGQLRELVQAARSLLPAGTAPEGLPGRRSGSAGSSGRFWLGVLATLVGLWAFFQFLPPGLTHPLRQLLVGG